MSPLFYIYAIKLFGIVCIAYAFLKTFASRFFEKKFGFVFSIFLMVITTVIACIFMLEVVYEVKDFGKQNLN
jgi:hypothetical protein